VPVQDSLHNVDRRYEELLKLVAQRLQRLQDALALYKVFNEADGVEQWIAEKVCLVVVLS
jgi:spectrin beta